MYGFLVLLHVLAAVFLVGPAVLSPLAGMRAIGRRDVEAVRRWGRSTLLSAALSLAIFGTGLLALSQSSRYEFTTVWVVISATLYVIAVVISAAALPATLARAARSIEDEGAAMEPDEIGDPASQTGLPGDSTQRAKGRIAALSGLVVVLYAAITVFMTLRPFSG
jgi:uncharacterized membrane protein